MTPHDVTEALRPHDAALRGLGLRSLALFGSAARGAARPDSDIDLLYEFAPDAATLSALTDLQSLLENIFDRDVDLVSQKYLSPILRRHIGGDVHAVFDARKTD